ncbi:MAG: DUF1329 domain-containing protein [Nevskia sp.]|nr:DUF1329 domain-containing protein [Nevskia sp.]
MGRWFGSLAALFASTAFASVGPDAAAQLGGRLTPVGGERAGSADGAIPEWDGGLGPQRQPAEWRAGSRYVDPFPGEKPLFEIGKERLADYAARLSPGQQALLTRYDSYRLPVYATHRSYAAPQAFYDGTLRNATRAFLDAPDGTPQHAAAGIPFPLPQNGIEAMWNQRLRWRGTARERTYVQVSVSPEGAASLVRLAERARYAAIDTPPLKKIGTVLGYTASAVFEPAKLAGTIKLVYDTLLPPPQAWQRSPGQRSIAATGEAGGDTPALGSNGLLHEDQVEGFNGSPARYEWKLRGKRELYVPYNAYRLHDAAVGYAELLGPHHVNPAYTRYELHRVWVLEGRCRPTQSCGWPRRTLYLDEDSWQVLLGELYDGDDRLAQLQEVHTLMAYDQPLLLPALETVYDLPSGRYLATGMNNQGPETAFAPPAADAFDPDEMRRWAHSIGAVAPRD